MTRRRRRFRGPRRRLWKAPPKGVDHRTWWAWYSRYLASKSWAIVRKARMTMDGYRCTLCPSVTNLVCHHLTYDRVGRERLSDLRTVCQTCHDDLHDAVKEMRAGLRQEDSPKPVDRRPKRERMLGPFVQDLTTRRRPKPA